MLDADQSQVRDLPPLQMPCVAGIPDSPAADAVKTWGLHPFTSGPVLFLIVIEKKMSTSLI